MCLVQSQCLHIVCVQALPENIHALLVYWKMRTPPVVLLISPSGQINVLPPSTQTVMNRKKVITIENGPLLEAFKALKCECVHRQRKSQNNKEKKTPLE